MIQQQSTLPPIVEGANSSESLEKSAYLHGGTEQIENSVIDYLTANQYGINWDDVSLYEAACRTLSDDFVIDVDPLIRFLQKWSKGEMDNYFKKRREWFFNKEDAIFCSNNAIQQAFLHKQFSYEESMPEVIDLTIFAMHKYLLDAEILNLVCQRLILIMKTVKLSNQQVNKLLEYLKEFSEKNSKETHWKHYKIVKNFIENCEILLVHAIYKNDEKLVEFLLENGASMNNVLGVALDKATEDVWKKLLKKGLDVDCADENDSTKLMWAAKKGYFDLAKRLLESGANVTLQDKQGLQALDYAKSGLPGNAAVVELIEKYQNPSSELHSKRPKKS